MKIDCEGAEYEILYNADDETINKIDKISMEIHAFDSNQKPEEMVSFLKTKGFNIHPETMKNNDYIYAYR